MAHRWCEQGLPVGNNMSRCDVSLTVWGVYDQSAVIALHSEVADKHRKSLQSRPYKMRLIDGKGDGDTLYLGSRSSALFTRIYDKEREQLTDEGYKSSLRYECECKERLAFDTYQRCIATGYSSASCVAVLVGLLLGRGIHALGVGGSSVVVTAPSQLPISTVENSLTWLEKQVSPTVRRLVREGYEEEVLHALGLERFIDDGSGYDD
jgi:DNA relaxase NicK